MMSDDTFTNSKHQAVSRLSGLEYPRLTSHSVSKSSSILQWVKQLNMMPNFDRPWLGWAFVYAVVLPLFSVYRGIALDALLKMYATSEEGTAAVVIGALMLGILEDFVCATYFAGTLWLLDTFLKSRINHFFSYLCGPRHGGFTAKVVLFMTSWLLFLAVTIPFVADVVTVRLRDVRFTFDLVTMAIEEKDHADAVAVSTSQITDVELNVAALVTVATFFAIVRTRFPSTDLSSWDPTQLPLPCMNSRAPTAYNIVKTTFHEHWDTFPNDEDLDNLTEHDEKASVLVINEESETKAIKSIDDSDVGFDTEHGTVTGQGSGRMYKCCERSVAVLVGFVVLPLFVVALSRTSQPVVAYLALNTTLNQLLKHALEPTDGSSSAAVESTQSWIESFIDPAEEYQPFGNNGTLFRRTTGFHGNVAFNVNVTITNPPNVLLIVVESFRYHDSHYLVGEKDPSDLFKGSNITITPNFDKWAKRGIALRNFWSSWRTSRSVESLLFGQLPYDSVTKSGMTGGQQNTKLSGLPQLFTAKGYETFFTTGCLTDYDNWDSFLPAHGFDTVWSRNEMKKLAESDLGISHGEWDGPEHRGLNWGVHDDLSFQLLGDLLVNKTDAQKNRVANGEAKKPLFLTHYTISSHVDFRQRPKWYAEAKKPDFSALYQGQKYADNIKNYLEIRYFTDMEFGKFMDRMAEAGILNDTIVVISGDHGQGPEFGNDVPEDRDVSATRVAGAIVAEGRLGDAVGMIMDDATEQYDILNTLADITGVPEGGFEQDGMGRSLKRRIKFGERVVYSNNPTRKMSVVRGHERLRYDKVTDSILLHNADTDHDMKTDLLPELSSKEKAEWMKWRSKGRQVNYYYTKRWEGKCLLAAEC